jgi:serine protease Do
VSATGRSTHINELESYIQTDAAVNPGNSGGPLINLNGEVVGINTAISTNSGGYDGVSFAIPVNMVRNIADQLIATGKVERSYLGVELSQLTPDLRDYFKAENGGALVNNVREDTPASKAGLKPGDVIVELAGKPIRNSETLTTLVEGLKSGEPQKMVVLRKGEEVTINVTPEPMPEDYTAALKRVRVNRDTGDSSEEKSALGFKVVNLTDEIASQLSVAEGTKGVVVKDVEYGGPAFEAGLRPRDVITSVDEKDVTSLEEFTDVVKSADMKRGVLLRVIRGNRSTLILLKSAE